MAYATEATYLVIIFAGWEALTLTEPVLGVYFLFLLNLTCPEKLATNWHPSPLRGCFFKKSLAFNP